MKRTTPLSGPDDFGTRWSYDRTISVRKAVAAFSIRDEITRTTHTRQSLDAARQIVRQVLDQRPQIEWQPAWKRHGRPQAVGTNWQIESVGGATSVWVERLPDNWWSIEVDADRHQDSRLRTYNWRVDGHHPIGVVQAQALAWAAHRTFNEESP